jgi:hypothetical protein
MDEVSMSPIGIVAAGLSPPAVFRQGRGQTGRPPGCQRHGPTTPTSTFLHAFLAELVHRCMIPLDNDHRWGDEGWMHAIGGAKRLAGAAARKT